jgi:hypothetical protein
VRDFTLGKFRLDRLEAHLKTANADMVAPVTKSSEVIGHNSAILEQIQKKLGA